MVCILSEIIQHVLTKQYYNVYSVYSLCWLLLDFTVHKNDKVFFLHIYMDSIKIHNVYMYTYTYLFIYRITTLYKQDLCVTILWQHI
jgi:hypothetical protein